MWGAGRVSEDAEMQLGQSVSLRAVCPSVSLMPRDTCHQGPCSRGASGTCERTGNWKAAGGEAGGESRLCCQPAACILCL